MHKNIDKITTMLGLNLYQANKLKLHYERYDVTGLQKRGGVLFAPYAERGVFGRLRRFFFGEQADLIGSNKVLLQAQRRIKFYANGYHSVRVGRYTYYANSVGQVVSKDEFLRNKSK